MRGDEIGSVPRRPIDVAAYGAFGLASAAVAYVLRPWRTADSKTFIDLGHSLSEGAFGRVIEGKWYAESTRPPLYPLFLCITHEWLHLPFGAVVAIQLAMLLAAVLVAQRLFPPRMRGAFSVALILASPALLAHSALIMTEALAILLVALVAAAALRPAKTHAQVATSGFLVGACLLLRPNFGPLLAIPALFLLFSADPLRQRVLRLVTFGACALVIALPYAWHNWRNYRWPLPMPPAAYVGNSLYLSSWEPDLSIDDCLSLYGQPSAAAKQSGVLEEAALANREIGVPDQTVPWTPETYPPELRRHASKVLTKYAVARIKREPGKFALRTLGVAFKMWSTTEYPSRTPRPIASVLRLAGRLLTALGLIGAFLALRRGSTREHRLAAAFVVLVLVTQPYFHLEARYTAHVRLMLLACAAWALAAAWAKLRTPQPLAAPRVLVDKRPE